MDKNLAKNLEKYFHGILLGIFALTFITVLLKPIELLNDSAGYLNMSLIRSPAYPLSAVTLMVLGIQIILFSRSLVFWALKNKIAFPFYRKGYPKILNSGFKSYCVCDRFPLGEFYGALNA